MLAIHWSPVSNTKKILKNGITKSKNGIYCFPLTGERAIDTWWVKAFNQYNFRKNKKKYNGFVFRIEKDYFRAYYGHWIGATSKDTFHKPIKCIEELESEFRQSVLFRIGERLIGYPEAINLKNDELIEFAIKEVVKKKGIYYSSLEDVSFMSYIFEDMQMVLENSIPPKKIINVISSQNEFGKILYKQKKQQYLND